MSILKNNFIKKTFVICLALITVFASIPFSNGTTAYAWTYASDVDAASSENSSGDVEANGAGADGPSNWKLKVEWDTTRNRKYNDALYKFVPNNSETSVFPGTLYNGEAIDENIIWKKDGICVLPRQTGWFGLVEANVIRIYSVSEGYKLPNVLYYGNMGDSNVFPLTDSRNLAGKWAANFIRDTLESRYINIKRNEATRGFDEDESSSVINAAADAAEAAARAELANMSMNDLLGDSRLTGGKGALTTESEEYLKELEACAYILTHHAGGYAHVNIDGVMDGEPGCSITNPDWQWGYSQQIDGGEYTSGTSITSAGYDFGDWMNHRGTGYVLAYYQEAAAASVPSGVTVIVAEQSSSTTQDMAYLVVPEEPEGSIKVIKKTDDASTLSNSNYDLAGAEFTLYTDANCTNAVETVATVFNSDTQRYEADFTNLDINTSYYIKETKAPKGYSLSTEVKTVNLDDSNFSVEIEFTNTPFKYNLQLKKVSANPSISDGNDCYSLAGAKFVIFNNYNFALAYADGVLVDYSSSVIGDTLNNPLVTDDNGMTGVLTGLYPGSYYALEIEAPKGYILPKDGKNRIWGITLTSDSPQENYVTIGTLGTAIYEATATLPNVPGNDPISIFLEKKDAEDVPNPQGSATLAGAQYTIKYYDEQAVDSGNRDENNNIIFTDPDSLGHTPTRTWVFQTSEEVVDNKKRGFINTRNPNMKVAGDDLYYSELGNVTFPLGVYTIQETKAPEGYEVEGTIYTFSLQMGQGGIVQATNLPTEEQAVREQVLRGGVSIGKQDYEKHLLNRTDSLVPQGDASLITSFNIVNINDNSVTYKDENGLVKNSDGTVKTFEKDEVIATITADSTTGIAKTVENALPYGKYRIDEVVPTGYTDKGISSYEFEIKENNVIVELGFAIEDIPIRGGVAIEKQDSTTVDGSTTAGYDLSGVKFTIKNKSAQGVLVDVDGDGEKEFYAPEEEIMTITTVKTADGKYVASTADNTLPYGTYSIKEVAVSNTDYRMTDTTERLFKIVNDGEIVTVDTSNKTLAAKNVPVRGDFQFVKQGSESELLANVAFLVTNTITNESHVIVTDDNGNFASSTDRFAHTLNTNCNDAAISDIDTYGYIKNESLNNASGVWFGTDINGNAIAVDDNLGALPKGQYTYTELACENNQGRKLVKGSFTIDGSFTVNLGTIIDNDAEPTMSTIALDDATKEHISIAGLTTIYDTVHIEGLIPGKTYTLKGTIKVFPDETVDFSVDGKYITSSKKFTADSTNMDVKVAFVSFDNTELAGKTFVVFEELYKNNTVIASHMDINSDSQSVSVGSIKTTAVDMDTEAQSGIISTTATIIDKVMYSGLVKNLEYTVKGILMDKETGTALLDADGNEITAETTFIPESSGGEVELIYTLDSSLLSGKTIVVFEDVYYQEYKVASHADIEDEKQTIYYSKIHTTATDSVTGAHVGNASEDSIIIDTISYNNLIPGITYKAIGVLMDKETETALLDADNKEITLEVTFTPDETDGTIDVEFNFDSTQYVGKSIVVFEKLYIEKEDETGNKEYQFINSHEDIDDVNQTVSYVLIGTVATDKETGNHVGASSEAATIIDTVTYNNLVAGETYKLTGYLMDKETGEAILDESGEKITSETVFVPKESNGTANVTFEFDARKLAGKTVVIFEYLYFNDVLIADHTDIDDEDQTIYYPVIRTIATDDKSKTHNVTVSDKTVINDAIMYENLIPGLAYKIEGILIDYVTAKPLLVDGKEVTATAEFIPESSSGETVVSFSFDSTQVSGATIVVYEYLYLNDIKVMSDADIDNTNETVYVPGIKTTAYDSETKTHTGVISKTAEIIDTVSYSNLSVGTEYTVKGILMDKEVNSPLLDADGNEITAETTFIPTVENDSVNLIYKLDSSLLAGKSVVVFEDLYQDTLKVISHSDINDKDQTVYYPVIKTTAIDKDTKIQTGVIGTKTNIVDTVTYTNLVVGQEYVMSGVLMDKTTGKALLNTAGSEITSSAKFTPEKENGTIDVVYTLDSSLLAGKTIVVFEDLYVNNIKVAFHADLEDKDQTVYYPTIKTNAIDKNSKTQTGIAGVKQTIVDKVSYTNLVVGQEYTVSGKLMDKATGKVLLNNDNKEITSTVTFKPEKSEGSIELIYELDSSLLAGKTVVVFEDLYVEKVKVTSHADLTDKDQTIYYPSVKTVAQVNNAKTSEVSSKSSIVDTITYTNLTAGREYTFYGILVVKETGKEFKLNNTTVTAQTKFKPEKAEGTATVKFEFDSTSLDGKSVVVYEYLYEGDTLVAAHTDINDKDQTVSFTSTPDEPKTGDETPLYGMIILFISAAFATIISAYIILKKRKQLTPQKINK